jgi:hypothetical protein
MKHIFNTALFALALADHNQQNFSIDGRRGERTFPVFENGTIN